MQIFDEQRDFNEGQKNKLRDIASTYLTSKGMDKGINKISLVKNCNVCFPENCFKDDSKSHILLYFSPSCFNKSNFEFIVCHELRHRIDELTPEFEYDNDSRQKVTSNAELEYIVREFWDIYINGRLYKERFTLQTDETDNYLLSPNNRLSGNIPNRRCFSIDGLHKRHVYDAENKYDLIWGSDEGDFSYQRFIEMASAYVK